MIRVLQKHTSQYRVLQFLLFFLRLFMSREMSTFVVRFILMFRKEKNKLLWVSPSANDISAVVLEKSIQSPRLDRRQKQ